jgi:DNA polymerase-3 subunit alpha
MSSVKRSDDLYLADVKPTPATPEDLAPTPENLRPILPKYRAKYKSENLTPHDFVHLHNHTNHSMLDGLTKIPNLVKRTKEFGQDAVAMTDHGTLSGWVEFYKTAKDQDIKPILGLETYVAARKIADRDPSKDKNRYHLTILASNQTGYHNLIKLSSIANLDGVYYKPRIDHDLLKEFNEGLIVLSGCASGEVGENLREGNYEKAKEIAAWYKSVFGDRYFMEVQDHGHPEAPKHWDVQEKINAGVLKIAEELQIPAVVTCDAHYLDENDTDVHEILLCVGTGSFLSDKNRMSLADFHLYVTDPKDIEARWGKDYPDLVLNTRRIADRCNVTIPMGKYLIPSFPCPDGLNEFSYLHQLVWRGLAWRYGEVDSPDNQLTEAEARQLLARDHQEVIDRADYELKVIHEMGFDGYFLIVQDFINWGKSQGIVFGPGRGSGAGSIVAYSIRITELEPLQYNLLFERFLNPDRISMPDIDTDIQDTRRDEVIAYCTRKYGADRVSSIATFGTMAGRSAVKDVARVLEVPYAEADKLSKLVPPPAQGHHQKLEDSIQNDPDLKKEYDSSPTSKRVMDYAVRLEGTIRSHGIHAAGTVIAPEPLTEIIPLEMAQKGVVATQFPGPTVEELGLLKMDFLGLSNLTIINNAQRIIKKVYGVKIDLEQIPMDDQKTYELFQRGETTGVFQFESAGMKRYLKELKPTKFDDIIAMVALYRPGPMSEIPKFIARAHGEEPVTYYEPHMENDLKDTYGILVYQEQFMNISKNVSGFTGGEADTLRKAVSKKKIDLMRTLRTKLIDGAVKKVGADKGQMEKFWDHLEDFASYCFNKSHAACYALVAYWTAYLKAYYPAAFMAALMTSDASNTDRLAIEIGECNAMGIKVLAPNINESFTEFAVVPGSGDIRFGLGGVKGVGGTAIEEIIKQRDQDGKFADVEDFARRCNSRVVNKKVWESLIKTGAFDDFATVDETQVSDDNPAIRGDRSDLLFNLENIVSFAQKVQKDAASGQEDLFGLLGDDQKVAGAETHLDLAPSPTKISDSEQLDYERELLGLYISAHPLDKYATYFRENVNALTGIRAEHDGCAATVGGVLNRWRVIQTKSGSKMAFAGIEDKAGSIEVVIFPKLYETLPEDLDVGKVVKIVGRVSAKDRDGNTTDPSIVADSLEILTDEMMAQYQPTGVDMGDIDPSKKSVKGKRGARGGGNSGGFNGGGSGSGSGKVVASATSRAKSAPMDVKPVEIPLAQKLYIHVKDPSDSAKLVAMKDVLQNAAGPDEVILVLGEDKSDAIRLPFTTAARTATEQVAAIYGADCVAVK